MHAHIWQMRSLFLILSQNVLSKQSINCLPNEQIHCSNYKKNVLSLDQTAVQTLVSIRVEHFSVRLWSH